MAWVLCCVKYHTMRGEETRLSRDGPLISEEHSVSLDLSTAFKNTDNGLLRFQGLHSGTIMLLWAVTTHA